MDEVEVVETIREHVERKFPMSCSACGHRFASAKEYLQYTTHVGKPISFDAESGDWRPWRPVGTFSFANCRCGTTLSVSSDGMALLTMWRLLRWAKKESSRRGIGVGDLLDGVRTKVDQQILRR